MAFKFTVLPSGSTILNMYLEASETSPQVRVMASPSSGSAEGAAEGLLTLVMLIEIHIGPTAGWQVVLAGFVLNLHLFPESLAWQVNLESADWHWESVVQVELQEYWVAVGGGVAAGGVVVVVGVQSPVLSITNPTSSPWINMST